MTAALEWDYSDLAAAYAKRPDYADAAIDRVLAMAGLGAGAAALDVGAGVGHLTITLVERGLNVTAVEPNLAMRERGRTRTAPWPDVRWGEGTGEDTGMGDDAFDLVTFGSSFNVTDRARALGETARVLKPRGWFACLWNHRDLDDPTQSAIERTSMGDLFGSVDVTPTSRISPMMEVTGPICGDTSADSALCASMSFSLTSCRAVRIGTSQSNSTKTMEMPTPDTDRTRCTPVMPFITVSMGKVTSDSTSVGDNPCDSLMMVTVGRFKSGSTSTFICMAS